MPALAAAALSQHLRLASCLELGTREAMGLAAFLEDAESWYPEQLELSRGLTPGYFTLFIQT